MKPHAMTNITLIVLVITLAMTIATSTLSQDTCLQTAPDTPLTPATTWLLQRAFSPMYLMVNEAGLSLILDQDGDLRPVTRDAAVTEELMLTPGYLSSYSEDGEVKVFLDQGIELSILHERLFIEDTEYRHCFRKAEEKILGRALSVNQHEGKKFAWQVLLDYGIPQRLATLTTDFTVTEVPDKYLSGGDRPLRDFDPFGDETLPYLVGGTPRSKTVSYPDELKVFKICSRVIKLDTEHELAVVHQSLLACDPEYQTVWEEVAGTIGRYVDGIAVERYDERVLSDVLREALFNRGLYDRLIQAQSVGFQCPSN